ncbi:hypothetical protein C8J95_10295 [Elizabethkingia sp. YR214]|uniref:hypothetical protein n=1 Tax=Elizabethkingia sp. YR214 TaxID=2135667 RepID=UPI000D316154|nr:hypothetical protein [Elizabethkingia sp. YR214]PUB34431.1 hypothetical protein C8J95_10295 [Elizabethkingia sp. YR214]
MRNKNLKQRILGAVVILAIGVGFTGCKSSNDSDNNPGGSIDPIIGTFKGTLEDGELKYYNAIISVTKVDDSSVRIAPKSGEAYSAYTAKTIKVSNPVGASVVGSNEQGSVAYLIDTKAINVKTEQTSPQEKVYLFNGSKQ